MADETREMLQKSVKKEHVKINNRLLDYIGWFLIMVSISQVIRPNVKSRIRKLDSIFVF